MKAGVYEVTYHVEMVQRMEIYQDEIDEHGEDVFEWAAIEGVFEYDTCEMIKVVSADLVEEVE